MKSNGQLFSLWIQRILANAFAGGFHFAGVGSACGLLAGALTGLFHGGWPGGFTGAFFGVPMGLLSGIPGSLIYAVAAARAEPGDALQPMKEIKDRVAIGQLLGTVGAASSFAMVELFRIYAQRITNSQGIDDSLLFMLIAPALMICGAIAGALWKRTNATIMTAAK